jgi:eukaryotic-like serine/threonine-protein kinase
MASVLLCEDERLDRLVAVKRLHADSPEDTERRFAREAKLGASLNHPNLVSVFDTATDDQGVLIVMEYVEGEPLSREVRRGPLIPDRVAKMATELGAALDHAHRQGVVHRDVKPGNVLLRVDGVTKLVDLGIATAAGHTRITTSGTVLGTAAYMAPEQLEGHEAGPPADIYALAAVCFEALCGERPRSGRTPLAIAHEIATEPPPDLRERWPSAPSAAVDALCRGMARKPEARPRSAGELALELKRALEEPPTAPMPRVERRTRARPVVASSPPAAPAPAARRPAAGSRSRLPMIALAAVFVALALAVGAAALMSGGDGGDGGDGGEEAGSPPAREQQSKRNGDSGGEAKQKQPKEDAPAAAPAPAEPAPTEPTPEEAEAPADEGGATDPVSGASLNEQGFELMGQGRYDEAIPILQRAVNSFPSGTNDLNYAYALFNLGKSLRLAGRPNEAVPLLERRLAIPNQTETVQAELDLARRAAGG